MSRRGLRIGGGDKRGLKVEVPPGIRPSSGRLRGALFDIWRDRLGGCVFLDLFAGSGAVGLEAASLGAARVVLVEGDGRVLAALRRNAQRLQPSRVLAVEARLPGELQRRLPAGDRFDLIFADPPYGFADHAGLLAAAEPLLATDGRMAVERSWREAEPPLPAGLVAEDRRRYGDSGLTLYRRPSRR